MLLFVHSMTLRVWYRPQGYRRQPLSSSQLKNGWQLNHAKENNAQARTHGITGLTLTLSEYSELLPLSLTKNNNNTSSVLCQHFNLPHTHTTDNEVGTLASTSCCDWYSHEKLHARQDSDSPLYKMQRLARQQPSSMLVCQTYKCGVRHNCGAAAVALTSLFMAAQ